MSMVRTKLHNMASVAFRKDTSRFSLYPRSEQSPHFLPRDRSVPIQSPVPFIQVLLRQFTKLHWPHRTYYYIPLSHVFPMCRPGSVYREGHGWWWIWRSRRMEDNFRGETSCLKEDFRNSGSGNTSKFCLHSIASTLDMRDDLMDPKIFFEGRQRGLKTTEMIIQLTIWNLSDDDSEYHEVCFKIFARTSYRSILDSQECDLTLQKELEYVRRSRYRSVFATLELEDPCMI